MERNCCSSQLPRDCNILRQFSGISLVLFTPDEKFDEQLSCTVLFVSFFYSYFCFTVVSMPSSLNPSIEHSHISSTCLYLKNCRWFFSAPCWYVAFCCCRAATLFLLPTSGLFRGACFLAALLPLVAKRGISAQKNGVLIDRNSRSREQNRRGFLVCISCLCPCSALSACSLRVGQLKYRLTPTQLLKGSFIFISHSRIHSQVYRAASPLHPSSGHAFSLPFLTSPLC